MRNEIDWPKEFELFMAKRRVKVDGQFIPVWDAWCFCFADSNYIGFDYFFKKVCLTPELYLKRSFIWTLSPFGYSKAARLNLKWIERIAEIKIKRARKEAFGYGC